MNGKIPTLGDLRTHVDGRRCIYRRYWAGNPRDGHWEYVWSYVQVGDPVGYWRYCGECNGK